MFRKKRIHLKSFPFSGSAAKITYFLFVACLFFGCSLSRETTPLREELPPPPEEVLERLFASPPEEGFRGTAKISLEVPEGKYFRTAALVMKYPDCLRIEALPLMGTPDLFLTADARFLKAYFPEENLFLVGRPTASNLYALFRLYLTVPDVVSLLMGLPPGWGDPRLRYAAAWEGSLYRADAFWDGEKIQSLWIDLEKKRLTRYETGAWNGHPPFQVIFREAVPVEGGGEVPGGISITLKEPVALFSTIRLIGLERVSTLPEDVFDLPVPQGAELRWMDGSVTGSEGEGAN